MAYPTRAELVAESNVAELTGATAAEQDAWYQASIIAVEDFCRQSFTDEPNVTRTVDGQGGRVLYLPRRLYAIDAVTVNGSVYDLADFTLSEKGDRLHLAAVTDTNYYSRALLDFAEPRDFVRGPGTVVITGDWGWAAPPASIRSALRMDMEDQAKGESSDLAGPVAAYRNLGVRSITQRGLSITLEDRDKRAGSHTGLSPAVQRLCGPHQWPAGYGVSV